MNLYSRLGIPSVADVMRRGRLHCMQKWSPLMILNPAAQVRVLPLMILNPRPPEFES